MLLRGRPGTGKSDLALRLVDGGGALVADDLCEIRRAGEPAARRSAGSAWIPAFRGRIELRGIGFLTLPYAGPTPLALVADLEPGAPAEAGDSGREARLSRYRPSPDRSRSIPGFGGREIAATGQGGGGGYNARSMSQAATTAPAPKAAPAAESLSGIEQSGAPLPVILVTGLSGAGHSTALRALEDLGYEAVDNLPLALLNAARELRPSAWRSASTAAPATSAPRPCWSASSA